MYTRLGHRPSAPWAIDDKAAYGKGADLVVAQSQSLKQSRTDARDMGNRPVSPSGTGTEEVVGSLAFPNRRFDAASDGGATLPSGAVAFSGTSFAAPLSGGVQISRQSPYASSDGGIVGEGPTKKPGGARTYARSRLLADGHLHHLGPSHEGKKDASLGWAREKTVSIVGPGRMGSAIARALRSAGWRIEAVVGATPGSANAALLAGELAARHVPTVAEAMGSELVVFSVSDASLDNCASEAAHAWRALQASRADMVAGAAFHTSGSRGAEALAPLAKEGWKVFAIHPAVSVPSRNLGPEIFREKWAAVEAKAATRRIATSIANDLGMRTFEIPEHARALYHLACTMASNFLVALEAMAFRIARDAEVADPARVLIPLVQGTLENLAAFGESKALSGPIARGDIPTLERHLHALRESRPELLELYIACSRAALELADLPELARARIEKLLESSHRNFSLQHKSEP